MKRFICGVLCGVIIAGTIGVFAASYVADVANFKVLVNGKEFVSAPPALVVNGSTYLPLRAMGEALGVPVSWNAKLGQAEVGISSNLNMKDVANYITKDVWNDGFWFLEQYINGSYVDYMDMYTETYASSAGEKFDVNKIIAHIINTKSTIDMYNAQLSNNEKWKAFYKEYNRLYEIVKSGTFTIDNFDTTFFSKVRDEFCESIK